MSNILICFPSDATVRVFTARKAAKRLAGVPYNSAKSGTSQSSAMLMSLGTLVNENDLDF